MYIYVLARTTLDTSHIPLTGLKALCKALATDQCAVVPDVRANNRSDFETAVYASGKQLRRIGRHNRPDVIHAFGTIAAAGAVRYRPAGARVVATFDESPADRDLEMELAREVDAVVAISEAEEAHWRELRVPTLSFGGIPALPIAALPCDPPRRLGIPRRDVITTSTGETLDALVEALPRWADARLVVVGRPKQKSWQAVVRHARALGVADRLQLRPDDSRVWVTAAVFVAGREVARCGVDCVIAAGHGVPAVAWAGGSHLDTVVPGITGRLINPHGGPRALAAAVGPLLADDVAVRALGESARVRACSLHQPDNSGERLRTLYQSLVGPSFDGAGQRAKLPCNRYDLVLEHLPYAAQLARRYAGRGQSLDDLVQVANLGLVNAAARFDPDRGSDFYSFATPTIMGELRRHFRDNAWALRVPRSLQEASMLVQVASEERAGVGLPARPRDLASSLGLSETEVLLAQQVHVEARSTHSLDMPVGDGSGEWVSDIIGEVDPALELVEQLGDVLAALRQLPERDREILLLRYHGELTQAEIADRFGMSQVQVSRLLSRTVAAIRDHVLYDAPLPPDTASRSPAKPGPARAA